MAKKEKLLQEQVMTKLIENGWTKKDFHNLDQLEQNFRKILVQRNINKLKECGVETLSNTEFDRVMNIIKENTTVSDYAKLLLDDSLPITLDNNKVVHLNLFEQRKWCTNTFEFVEELSNTNTTTNTHRYDIVLLINGLPISNIELKHRYVSLKQAFNQTNRYHNELSGLLKFIQIYVITNESNTYYYANNKVFNPKFAFNWVDVNNEVVKNIFYFVDSFLEKCHFSEYISRYIINKENSHSLIALRGYQVHAVRKIIEHIKQSKDNGYIWHTTGSGKTITSFKAAQIIKRDCDVDKVIFLVDRKDLDSQTIKEYNSFLLEHQQLQKTDNTRILKRNIVGSEKLIVTTLQKMDRLIQKHANEIQNVKNQRIVFIIDECHRSTFGDMFNRINDFFKNAQYIGFTGTPIFASEQILKGELVTNDVFKKCLHKYLIKNAIQDNNVLPFQMDYYDTKEVPTNLSQYLASENYLNKVVEDIINIHDIKTNKREFFAIATFTSIETVIKVYQKFKQKQLELQQLHSDYIPLKIAATFSKQGNENDNRVENEQFLTEMIADFNEYTNSNESVYDLSNYQARLQSVIKNEKEIKIDLVLVVDQLLTGFDAKLLNTIYIAKNLTKHNLIQAMSRTNRIFNANKVNGIVVSYVPGLKQNVVEAVKIYSDSLNSEAFITRSYKELLNDGRSLLATINNFDINNIKNNPLKNIQSIEAYNKTSKQLQDVYKEIRTFREFDSMSLGQYNNKENFSVDAMKTIVNNAFELKKQLEVLVHEDEIDNLDKEKIQTILASVEMPLIWKSQDLINHQYIIKMISASQEEFNENPNSTKSLELVQKRIQDGIDYFSNDEEAQNTKLVEYLKEIKNNPSLDIQEQLYQKIMQEKLKITAEFALDEKDIQQEIINLAYKEKYDVANRSEKIKEKISTYKFKLKKDKRTDVNQIFQTLKIVSEILEDK